MTRGRGERSQSHDAECTATYGAEVGLGLSDIGQDDVGVRHEQMPGRGQAQRASLLLEQRHAGLAFEHGQLLGDGGTGQVQCVRCGADRPARSEFTEQREAAQIKH